MLKFKLLALPSFIVLFCVCCAPNPRYTEMKIARQEIGVTASVIVRARKAVYIGKIYTGDLANSINHQKFAIALYNAGEFRRSINQTRYARRRAFKAIQANNGVISGQELASIDSNNGPSDDKMESEVQKNGQDDAKDQDVTSQDTGKAQDDSDIQVK